MQSSTATAEEEEELKISYFRSNWKQAKDKLVKQLVRRKAHARSWTLWLPWQHSVIQSLPKRSTFKKTKGLVGTVTGNSSGRAAVIGCSCCVVRRCRPDMLKYALKGTPVWPLTCDVITVTSQPSPALFTSSSQNKWKNKSLHMLLPGDLTDLSFLT